MIPKTKKIKRSLFQEVFLLGKNKNSQFFRVKVRESDDLKFGFVIPKKVYKKAVDRNRIKRVFFNTIKELDFEPKKSEYIFFSQKSIKGVEDKDIQEDIINFLKENK